MDLNFIKNEWKKDCEIDITNLGKSSIETAKLHCKYLSFLLDIKQSLTDTKFKFAEAKKIKIKYYKGELTKDELIRYGWEQYQYNKPLKSEMEDVLNGDPDIIEIKQKIENIENLIYALESILGQIKSRDFQIKNSITWQQYVSGG